MWMDVSSCYNIMSSCYRIYCYVKIYICLYGSAVGYRNKYINLHSAYLFIYHDMLGYLSELRDK